MWLCLPAYNTTRDGNLSTAILTIITVALRHNNFIKEFEPRNIFYHQILFPGSDHGPGLVGLHLQISKPSGDGLLRTEIPGQLQSDGRYLLGGKLKETKYI